MLRFVTRIQKKYTQEVHFTKAGAIESRTTQLARGSPSQTLVHVASKAMPLWRVGLV